MSPDDSLLHRPSRDCDECNGKASVKPELKHESFKYGADQDAADLTVELPVWTCQECGFSYEDEEAERLRHEAVCRHLGVLSPRQIRELRQRHGLSRADLARLTCVGEASIKRWESGALIQTAANNRLLQLVDTPAVTELRRLAAETEPLPPAAPGTQVSESRTRPYGARAPEDAELSKWIVGNLRQTAESPEQGFINRTLLSSLERLIRLRDWKRVFAGSGTFFAWKKGDPSRHVAPDLYLLDEPPALIPSVWCTWLPDNPPPRFAVEVVARDWLKDYVLDPAKYEELGCNELVIFDPHATPEAAAVGRRAPLTVFRPTDEGRLEKAYAGDGPAWSQQLGAWLVPGSAGQWPTLRLSEDETGTRIVLTSDESDEATGRELARREAELERAEQEVHLLKTQLQEAQAETTTRRPRRSSKPEPGDK